MTDTTDQQTGVSIRTERLSRSEIVAAALSIVDTVGSAGFTMRQLGAALGVQAMSVYRYFPSRQAVLDAVVDQVGTDPIESGPAEPSGDTWRTYLEQLAHRTRKLAVNHPELFRLMTFHPTPVPWLRPPIRTVREADRFARQLITDDFSPAAAAAAYKRFTAFLLGHLLGELPQVSPMSKGPAAAAATPLDGDASPSCSVDTTAYPHAAVMARLLGADAEATFRGALRRLLDDVACLRHS